MENKEKYEKRVILIERVFHHQNISKNKKASESFTIILSNVILLFYLIIIKIHSIFIIILPMETIKLLR